MSEEKPRRNRRSGDFVERLSIILVAGAFVGGYIVLMDLRFTLTLWGQVMQLGKDGFAAEAKGMVLQSMLISGLAAVIAYWLSTTKQGQDQAQTVSQMAAAAAPIQAAAVAAARAEPLPPVAPNAVTPAELNLETGNVPAAEVAKTP